MADVRPGLDGSRRGQLLLTGAIVVALLLVGLVLVLNSVIFTESLATREAAGDTDASVVRETVAEGLGGVLRSVNTEGGPGVSYEQRRARYRDGVKAFGGTLSRELSTDLSVVSVRSDRTSEGTRIVQDTERTFRPRATGDIGALGYNGFDTWSVLPSGTPRAFQLTVDGNDLQTADPSAVGTMLGGPDGAATTVLFVETVGRNGRTIRIAIYDPDDTTAEDVAVTVYDSDGGTVSTCRTATATDVSVELTAERLDGERCAALSALGDLRPPTTTWFATHATDSERAVGTYELTADRSEPVLRRMADRGNDLSCASPATFGSADTEPPYTVPAVYSGTTTVEYEGSAQRYRTEVRVAPGEPIRATQPVVETFIVRDGTSSFGIETVVDDPDGDLQTVTVRLVEVSSASVVDSVTVSDGGSGDGRPDEDDPEADGLIDLTGSDGVTLSGSSSGTDYRIEVIAADAETERVVAQTQTADGDDDPCAGTSGSTSNQPPDAAFSYSPSSPDEGETTTFDASASSDSDGLVESYEWDFDGDGTTDRTGETVTYSASSDYTAELTVTDDSGATDTTTRSVDVQSSGTAPSVDSMTITDNGYKNGNDDFIRYVVDWEVSDPDGSGDSGLRTVTVTLTDKSGASRVKTVSVSGGSASGTTRFEFETGGGTGCNSEYDITVAVEDGGGNTDSETRTDSKACD